MENNESTFISGALNIRAPINKISINEIRIKPRTPASTRPSGCLGVLPSTRTLKNGGTLSFLDHFIPLGGNWSHSQLDMGKGRDELPSRSRCEHLRVGYLAQGYPGRALRVSWHLPPPTGLRTTKHQQTKNDSQREYFVQTLTVFVRRRQFSSPSDKLGSFQKSGGVFWLTCFILPITDFPPNPFYCFPVRLIGYWHILMTCFPSGCPPASPLPPSSRSSSGAPPEKLRIMGGNWT